MQVIKCPKCGEKFELDGVGLADILKQVRDQQFEEELKKRVQADVNLAIEQTRNASNEEMAKIKDNLAAVEAERILLNVQKEKALAELQAAKDREIAELKAQVDKSEIARKLSINEAVSKVEKERDELKVELVNQEKEKMLIKESYEKQLEAHVETIEYYKDFKLKLSTKMIGESLEQYCYNEFSKIRAWAFPEAYFDKDNDAKSGSKGDFIFRDPAQGVESLSIMFEMKNESEETVKKQKNESFYAKLDKDRNTKKCEYAILVTTLEEDNDLFNQGILDVSHLYPKMYVVRPQFFIPLLTLLKNAADKSITVKNELALIRSQNIDVTNFEDDLNSWKASFLTSISNAGKKHLEALDQIDKLITNLQKVRELLTTSDKHLIAAESKMEDLTVKRLTRRNPTMQAKFAELEKAKGE